MEVLRWPQNWIRSGWEVMIMMLPVVEQRQPEQLTAGMLRNPRRKEAGLRRLVRRKMVEGTLRGILNRLILLLYAKN